MLEYKIQNVSELQATRVNRFADEEFFCFRGQSDASWNLIPSIYRGLEKVDPPIDESEDGVWIGEIERDLYREFGKHARIFAKENWLFTNKWHQIFLAQHYGIPTRLLDWTRNILVAAYFAVMENHDKDGAIWCLNVSNFPFPKALGRLARNRGFRLEVVSHCVSEAELSFFLPQSKPLVAGNPSQTSIRAFPSDQSGDPNRTGFLAIVDPPVLEDRIKSQQGIFSIYISEDEYDFAWNQTEYIKMIEANHSKELLYKLVIPNQQKASIRAELEKVGIDPYAIFPDLEGLTRLIKQEREYLLNFNLNGRKKWLQSSKSSNP